MPLSNDQVDKLKLTLRTAGWNEVIRPVLAQRADTALKALALFPSEREKDGGEWKDKSDDQIRTALQEMQWFSAVWLNEIAVYDHNRRLEELDRQAFEAENPPPPQTARGEPA